MRKIPKIGQRVRDTRTKQIVEVIGIEGITRSRSGLFVRVRPVGGDPVRMQGMDTLVPLADVERLH